MQSQRQEWWDRHFCVSVTGFMETHYMLLLMTFSAAPQDSHDKTLSLGERV